MKTNNNLVIEVYRAETVLRGNVIRISGQSAEILKRLQRATGLPISALANKMIEYASDRVEIKEVR